MNDSRLQGCNEHQREKGKRGEREAAKVLSEMGIESRRGQQFSGSADSPNVVSALADIHIEVKRCERLSLYAAIEQADDDAGEDKRPLLLHRRNHKQWLFVGYLSDLQHIAAAVGNAHE